MFVTRSENSDSRKVWLVADVEEADEGQDLVRLAVAVVDEQVLEVLEKLHQEEVEDANGELKVISLPGVGSERRGGKGGEEGERREVSGLYNNTTASSTRIWATNAAVQTPAANGNRIGRRCGVPMKASR